MGCSVLAGICEGDGCGVVVRLVEWDAAMWVGQGEMMMLGQNRDVNGAELGRRLAALRSNALRLAALINAKNALIRLDASTHLRAQVCR